MLHVGSRILHARYLFLLTDKKKPLFVGVNQDNLTISYGQEENIDIYAKLSPEVMEAPDHRRKDDLPASIYDRRDDGEGKL